MTHIDRLDAYRTRERDRAAMAALAWNPHPEDWAALVAAANEIGAGRPSSPTAGAGAPNPGTSFCELCETRAGDGWCSTCANCKDDTAPFGICACGEDANDADGLCDDCRPVPPCDLCGGKGIVSDQRTPWDRECYAWCPDCSPHGKDF